MVEPKDQNPGEPKDQRPGERARDEKRPGGPRYGGESWEVADKRDEDERFGKARNDAPPDPLRESQSLADELPRVVGSSGEEPDPDENLPDADARIESGGEHEGFGRGSKPRKPKFRTKPNP